MPYQYGFIDPSTAASAAASSAAGNGVDPLDAFVASQAASAVPKLPVTAAPKTTAADPLDAFIASQGGLSKPSKSTSPAAPADTAGLGRDLAAGGASPYGLDDLKQIGSGAWHGLSSLFNNTANVVEKGIAAGANAIPGVAGSSVGDWLTNTANSDVAAQSSVDRQFKQTASAGEKASAIVAPLLMPAGGITKLAEAVKSGVSVLPMMGGAVGRVLGTGLGNAATGAALAAGADVDPTQPFWSQVGKNMAAGGTVGVGLPALFSGTKSVGTNLYNAARPIFNPTGYVGEGLAAALGDDAATVASQIRSAPEYVPGSLPTLAQAAPNPTLVATEKAAANGLPGFKVAQAERENANNQARWDALGGVAGTPVDLDAALAAREAAAGPAYQAARAQTYPVDQPLETLMQRPAMQEALARGVAIARNEGKQGLMPAVQAREAQYANLPTGGTGFNGQPLFQQVLTKPEQSGQPAQISGDVLHYIKLGMDDLQQSAQENTKLGQFQRNAINTAQRDFLGWLDNASPDYAQGRAAYAANSPAVNTMQVGQQVADSVGGLNRPLNSSGTPLMTAPGYATALGRALRAQDFGIEPGGQQTLENIGHDLQRSTISNSLRAPGSDTAYNLTANGWLAKRLYGTDFQGGNVGKLIGATLQAGGAAGGAALFGPTGAGVGSAVGSGIGSLLNGSRVSSRLNKQLGELLLNPHALLPYLDAGSSLPAQVGNQALGQALLRNIYPAAAGAVGRSGFINSN